MSPSGRRFTHEVAHEYSQHSHLLILCGHYEGVDQRVIDTLTDDEISIGDYVLTGGELPAMVIADTLYLSSEDLVSRRDRNVPLFSTEVMPGGEPAPHAFTLHGKPDWHRELDDITADPAAASPLSPRAALSAAQRLPAIAEAYQSRTLVKDEGS